MLGLGKTLLRWEEGLEGGRTSCTFQLQVGRTPELVLHGSRHTGLQRGRAAVGSASRAELVKVSRGKKQNHQISNSVQGVELGVGAVMCCEWNLFDCEGKR